MKKVSIKDTNNIETKSKRKHNQAGYLILPDCVIARSGILQYSDVITETGDVVADGALIQVNRPAEALKNCYMQFANLPLTLEHPDDDEVNPENAKTLTVGCLGSNPKYQEKNGVGYIICDIIVYDDEAQKKIESGDTVELSAGYETAFRQKRGITPMGQQYEAEQFLLSPNHVALVERGRCGSECRVCDSKNKITHKHVKTGDVTMGKAKKTTKNRYFLPVGDSGEVIELTEEQADQIIANDPNVEIEEKDEDEVKFEEEDIDLDKDDEEKDIDVDVDEEDEDIDVQGIDTDEEEDVDLDKDDEDEDKKDEKEDIDVDIDEDKKDEEEEGSLTFEVQFDDGAIGKMDEVAYEHVKRFLDVAKSDKRGDSLSKVLSLTSRASKILGPSFDIEKYTKADSVDTDAIKRDIVRKVMPGVVVGKLKSTALDSLYESAIKTHAKKADSYKQDIAALCKIEESTVTKADSKGGDMVSKAKAQFIKKIHKN